MSHVLSVSYNQFTAFQKLERREIEIIHSRAGMLGDPYGECGGASLKLMDDMLNSGFDACILRCQGLKTDAPLADLRWHDLGDQLHWVHYVVKCESSIIDLTRRQFFPLSFYPFRQSYRSFLSEWETISAVV